MLMNVVLQLPALFCLLLSMDKHFKVVFKTSLSQKMRYGLKISGWGAMLLSILTMMQLSGVEIVYWLAYLSFNIVLVISLYTWFFAKKA